MGVRACGVIYCKLFRKCCAGPERRHTHAPQAGPANTSKESQSPLSKIDWGGACIGVGSGGLHSLPLKKGSDIKVSSLEIAHRN